MVILTFMLSRQSLVIVNTDDIYLILHSHNYAKQSGSTTKLLKSLKLTIFNFCLVVSYSDISSKAVFKPTESSKLLDLIKYQDKKKGKKKVCLRSLEEFINTRSVFRALSKV